MIRLLGLAVIAAALVWAGTLYVLRSQPTPALAVAANARPMAVRTPLPPEEKASRLELNAATLEELIALPGIGEKTAQAILDERERLGGFAYAEDLLLVKGIGEGKLNAIYDLIYVETEE